MTFIQRIHPTGDGRCGEVVGHNPGECHVIDCVTTEPVLNHETGEVIHPAGAVVWHSHFDAGVHPEHRLNPDHPAKDHRKGKPRSVSHSGWCDDCKAHPAYETLKLS